jgi:hypothetical protein
VNSGAPEEYSDPAPLMVPILVGWNIVLFGQYLDNVSYY